MKRIATYFVSGLLFLTPIAATLYILYIFVSSVDQIFSFSIPGVGFLLTLTVITVIGLLVSTFLARGTANVIDGLFRRLPIIKMVYMAISDVLSALVGAERRFDKPVLVNIATGSRIQILGFVTRTSIQNPSMVENMAVYIPQAYTFAGNLILVPKDQVTYLEVESSKAMAFIVSGGVSGLE
jgi:uncharacterized membrane protein